MEKSGILLINKPYGMTSRDVVNIVSKKLNTRKVGHTGTLDPIATGLMILCVNKATKLIELITSNDKEYIAKVKLGIKTDTLDVTGNIIDSNNSFNTNKEDVTRVLNSFLGTYLQEVPIYSAIKVNGKKLYEYARGNKEVILPKREVNIKEIELLEYNNDSFKFRVLVSKGTYIRSLIRDIGDKLNIYATMEELIRTKIDNIKLDDSKNIDDDLENSIIDIKDFLDFKKVNVNGDLLKKVSNGCKIENIYDLDYVMFLDDNNKLISIYKKCENNKMCSYKVF